MMKARTTVLWMVTLLGIGFIYGFVSHRHHVFPYGVISFLFRQLPGVGQESPPPPSREAAPPGFWMTSVDSGTERLTAEQRQQLERVATLGYLGGYTRSPEDSGVVLHDSTRTDGGYNLYTSGHAPEAILMDMDGAALHTWRYPRWHEWHEGESPSIVGDYWRRAALLPNGDLLVIYDGLGLVKLNRGSELLWEYRGAAHHDLDVTEDGNIYVLTREMDKQYPEILGGEPIYEDFVAVLDSSGNEMRRVSLVQALRNSEYSAFLDVVEVYDLFHANTVEVLDGRLARRSPAFRAGNVLVCLRNIDAIAVVDPERERVVWAVRGMWRLPHQPTVLDNGNFLLFDNRGHHGKSKVIEFDPFTLEIRWAYKGTPRAPFESPLLGSNQRLPNGNTVITESTRGRAFEVTPEGEIVWEFLNPRRAGDDGDLIAVIPEMVRIPRSTDLGWAQ